MKNKFIVLLIVFSFQTGFAQIQFSGSANLEGYYSKNENLPFWFYSNQRGRIDQTSNLSTWINGKANYQFSENARLEVGGGLFYSDGGTEDFSIDELYAQLEIDWLRLLVGAKQEEKVLNGLSASNKNILWSLNSRPIPGVKIETSRPIFLFDSEKIGFEFYWSESYLGDNTGADNVRLHHKRIQLLYKPDNSWTIKAGLRHFVQWGGTSERFGEQPEGFSDYLKVVTGRGGGDNSVESDQANALGNHLGSWEFSLHKKFENNSISFIYNNLFEDGSGSRLANFPDGRYALFYDTGDNSNLFNSFLYEFYYTKEQSQTGPHLYDNYFNNGVYPFGWTYKNRVIGTPFFTYNQELNYVVNNKFLAHHIGFSGGIPILQKTIPYKFLFSYVNKEGLYSVPAEAKLIIEDDLNLYFEFRLMKLPVTLNLILGADFNSENSPNIGAGVSLSKQF